MPNALFCFVNNYLHFVVIAFCYTTVRIENLTRGGTKQKNLFVWVDVLDDPLAHGVPSLINQTRFYQPNYSNNGR